MKGSSFDRRRKMKFAFGVLAVGITVSAIVGAMLVFISRMRPHY